VAWVPLPCGMMVDAVEPEAAKQASERVERQTRVSSHLASVLRRTAKELERSATLAEQHAQHRERAGRKEAAAMERRAARRAHEAALRARAQAERWLKRFEEREI